MKTALILDADLSFAYWLEQGLDEAGYLAFPAKNAADAAALPDEFKNGLDLLIVNPSVPGTAKLIETLRQWNEHIKVVALMGDELPPKPLEPRPTCIAEGQTHSRPTRGTDGSGASKNCYR